MGLFPIACEALRPTIPPKGYAPVTRPGS